MSLPKNVIEERIRRQMASLDSPSEIPERRAENCQGSVADRASRSFSSPLVASSDSEFSTPTDVRKTLSMDSDSSTSQQSLLDDTVAVSPTVTRSVVSLSESPLSKIKRNGTIRRILESPGPSPCKEEFLLVKRPSFLVFDENSSDSGYASLPTDDTQRMKRSHSGSVEGPTKVYKVEDWFNKNKEGHCLSPSLVTKSSTSSLDVDGFPVEMIAEEEESEFSAPSGFTSLLSSPLTRHQSSSLRRSISRSDQSSSLRRSISKSDQSSSLRRSISMSGQFPVGSAARFKKPTAPARVGPVTRSMTRRSVSTGQELEKRKILMDLKQDPEVLPDGSKKYCLPSVSDGKHAELRTISCHTLANLIRGCFSQVRSFSFEFQGGHIRGAENWQHGEEEKFLSSFLPATALPVVPLYSEDSEDSRDILVFHCEFSSQRGPDFYRKLRARDRGLNAEVFPALYYPECYLLHLGYKEFYDNYPDLCSGGYTAMVDERHKMELRMMRARSKSWTGGTVARTGTMSRWRRF